MTIKELVEQQFLEKLGYFPDIDNPKTLNEKIQWLKLYYRDPLMTICADKYAVRAYISKSIGKKYLTPLLGVYKQPADIPYDILPNRFVLKLNDGSGKNIVCKNKSIFDINRANAKLTKWQNEPNHYHYSYEWAYKNIPPKIVCESFIEQKNGNLSDYKFFCFQGKVKYLIVTTGKRNEKSFRVTFFDPDWKCIPVKGANPPSEIPLSPPRNFRLMLRLAEKLSTPFPFARIDMYNVNGNIFAGEITFYPSNGMSPLTPRFWEYRFGKYLRLDELMNRRIKSYLSAKSKRRAKTVIYTAITRMYDNLLQHKHVSDEFDYVCFSDTPIKEPGIWEIRKLTPVVSDQVRNARYYKLFPHKLLKEYEQSVWIDANIDVIDDALEKRVNQLITNKDDLAVNIHYERDCIYDEATECIKQKKDNPTTIKRQVQFLRNEKYPAHHGLFETNLIYRKHNSRSLSKTMLDWWKKIHDFSRRDQLSFNYVLWKNRRGSLSFFPESIRDADGFLLHPHNPKVVSAIFIDRGKGFEEKNSMNISAVIVDNRFKYDFNISKFSPATRIKFNIAQNKFCLLKIDKITMFSPKESVKVKYDQISFDKNAKRLIDGFIDFPSSNPEVVFPVMANTNTVTIEGQVKFYDIENRFFELELALKKIKSSKAYRFWTLSHRLEGYFSPKSKQTRSKFKVDVTSIKEYGDALQKEYDEITNSRFYKLWQDYNSLKNGETPKKT